MPNSAAKPNRKGVNPATPPVPEPAPDPQPAPVAQAPSAMSAQRYSAWTVVGIVAGVLALVAVAGLAGAAVGFGYGRATARAAVAADAFRGMMPYGLTTPYGFTMPHGDPDDMPFGMMGRLNAGQPFLGVTYGDVDPATAQQRKLRPGEGAQVSAVTDGSPAAKAGIQAGDIILAVDGQRIAQSPMLRRLIRDRQPGDQVSLLVLRNGDEQTIVVTLGEAQDLQTP